jgi:hypothetical protein
MSTFASSSQIHASLESHRQDVVGAADASDLALEQLVTLLARVVR